MSKEEIFAKFSDPDSQKKLVKKISEPYFKLSKIVSENLKSTDDMIQREAAEAIRNFSIVSGAFAAFTTPLLAVHQSVFFAIGIGLHIVAVMISIGFIFGILDIRSKGLIRDSKLYLDPVQRKNNLILDFLKGKIAFEKVIEDEFNKDFTDFHDEFSKTQEELTKKQRGLNYTPDVAFTIFVLANSLILYAFFDWIIIPVLSNSLVFLFV